MYKGYKADDGSVAAIKKVKTVTKEDKRKAGTEAFRFHYLKDEILQQNEHMVKIVDVKYYQCAVWIVTVTAPDRYNCLFEPGLLDNRH